MNSLEQEVLSRLKSALLANPYWHPAINYRTCVPMKVPGFESILMCPFMDCSPFADVKDHEPTELEKALREGAQYLIQLVDDLKAGRVIEVSPSFGHVYRHIWKEEAIPSPEEWKALNEQPHLLPPTVKREACTDFLKLWGVWFYIADCPRTGLRFVEGIKK